MDILILLAVFTLLCATGTPIEAVMLKISDGVDNFSLLAIPFFVLAGAKNCPRRRRS